MNIILWHRLLEPYEAAVDELILKFNRQMRAYRLQGRYCPMEHVTGRVKSITSILDKMQRKNVSFDRLETEIEDIAGIRIICQFVEDIDIVAKSIQERRDIRVTEVKDYVQNQKESGYRSYHMVGLYTVQTLDGPKELQVEIQIRTMAMDFWATTEHSLQYKYQGKIPPKVSARLSGAANAIIALDREMSTVREEIMDAQLSNKLRYNLVEDIVSSIENLYRLTSRRQVEKIQEEFYRIYQMDDFEELLKFHGALDQIAEAYRAQSNERGDGIKKTAEMAPADMVERGRDGV